MNKKNFEQVVVIVPAYNESTVLESTLRKLGSYFTNVVLVDDGSQDSTSWVGKNCGVTVITHPINLGQGAAIMTGIIWGLQNPVNSFFATFDADGQHRVDDLISAVRCQIQDGCDVVLGSRFLTEQNSLPKSKKVFLKIATFYTRFTTGLRVTDTHNGIRLVSRRVAEVLDLTNGMSHASEILRILSSNDFSVAEIPVTIEYTDYSKSKGQPLINSINIVYDDWVRGKK